MYLDKNGFPIQATPNHETFTDADKTTVAFTEDGGAQVWWNIVQVRGENSDGVLSLVLERQDNSTVQVIYNYEKPVEEVVIEEQPKELPEKPKEKADEPEVKKEVKPRKATRAAGKKPRKPRKKESK